ncbi:MAG: hypothetical protein KIT18_04940 [Burkholderiales bacterium]|nr:hypothetical protein [Burkholderiales bacterium]
MEREHTLRILNALANGVDPATGERFGANSTYQHPDTVRALFEAVRAVERLRTAAPATAPAGERKATPPQNGAGSRWTVEEEQRLTAAFDAGKTVDELARLHGRSRAGIEARLLKLGKIDAAALTSPLRYPPKPDPRRAQQKSTAYRAG